MKYSQIELESLTLGRQSFSPVQAKRLLALQGTWRLPQDSVFDFDGQTFTTKEVKPAVKVAKTKKVTKKETGKKDGTNSTKHIGDTATSKQDANDTSSKSS